jgi:hypothetical protein
MSATGPISASELARQLTSIDDEAPWMANAKYQFIGINSIKAPRRWSKTLLSELLKGETKFGKHIKVMNAHGLTKRVFGNIAEDEICEKREKTENQAALAAYMDDLGRVEAEAGREDDQADNAARSKHSAHIGVASSCTLRLKDQ